MSPGSGAWSPAWPAFDCPWLVPPLELLPLALPLVLPPVVLPLVLPPVVLPLVLPPLVLLPFAADDPPLPAAVRPAAPAEPLLAPDDTAPLPAPPNDTVVTGCFVWLLLLAGAALRPAAGALEPAPLPAIVPIPAAPPRAAHTAMESPGSPACPVPLPALSAVSSSDPVRVLGLSELTVSGTQPANTADSCRHARAARSCRREALRLVLVVVSIQRLLLCRCRSR
jgi:hypothetical protein